MWSIYYRYQMNVYLYSAKNVWTYLKKKKISRYIILDIEIRTLWYLLISFSERDVQSSVISNVLLFFTICQRNFELLTWSSIMVQRNFAMVFTVIFPTIENYQSKMSLLVPHKFMILVSTQESAHIVVF